MYICICCFASLQGNIYSQQLIYKLYKHISASLKKNILIFCYNILFVLNCKLNYFVHNFFLEYNSETDGLNGLMDFVMYMTACYFANIFCEISGNNRFFIADFALQSF